MMMVLDLLDHRDLVALDEADLRCRLHGDGAREVEIGEFLLEARALRLEVLRGLRVLGAPCRARSFDELRKGRSRAPRRGGACPR